MGVALPRGTSRDSYCPLTLSAVWGVHGPVSTVCRTHRTRTPSTTTYYLLPTAPGPLAPCTWTCACTAPITGDAVASGHPVVPVLLLPVLPSCQPEQPASRPLPRWSSGDGQPCHGRAGQAQYGLPWRYASRAPSIGFSKCHPPAHYSCAARLSGSHPLHLIHDRSRTPVVPCIERL